jgi:hypothetical protein
MHIENIIIDIKILETGERIPLDLTFVRGDTDADIDEVFVKIRKRICDTANGRSYKILR